MRQLLNRTRFVRTLGMAGLGLGLLAGTASVPLALAQEPQAPMIERPLFHHDEGTLDLSDDELHDLLIQLLQEREQAQAADVSIPADEAAPDMIRVRGDHEDIQVEAYHAFTEALADELGLASPEEADAAIRAALKATVDANTGLSARGAEEQKALIEDAPVPIGPAYRGFGG